MIKVGVPGSWFAFNVCNMLISFVLIIILIPLKIIILAYVNEDGDVSDGRVENKK